MNEYDVNRWNSKLSSKFFDFVTPQEEDYFSTIGLKEYTNKEATDDYLFPINTNKLITTNSKGLINQIDRWTNMDYNYTFCHNSLIINTDVNSHRSNSVILTVGDEANHDFNNINDAVSYGLTKIGTAGYSNQIDLYLYKDFIEDEADPIPELYPADLHIYGVNKPTVSFLNPTKPSHIANCYIQLSNTHDNIFFKLEDCWIKDQNNINYFSCNHLERCVIKNITNASPSFFYITAYDCLIENITNISFTTNSYLYNTIIDTVNNSVALPKYLRACILRGVWNFSAIPFQQFTTRNIESCIFEWTANNLVSFSPLTQFNNCILGGTWNFLDGNDSQNDLLNTTINIATGGHGFLKGMDAYKDDTPYKGTEYNFGNCTFNGIYNWGKGGTTIPSNDSNNYPNKAGDGGFTQTANSSPITNSGNLYWYTLNNTPCPVIPGGGGIVYSNTIQAKYGLDHYTGIGLDTTKTTFRTTVINKLIIGNYWGPAYDMSLTNVTITAISPDITIWKDSDLYYIKYTGTLAHSYGLYEEQIKIECQGYEELRYVYGEHHTWFRLTNNKEVAQENNFVLWGYVFFKNLAQGKKYYYPVNELSWEFSDNAEWEYKITENANNYPPNSVIIGKSVDGKLVIAKGTLNIIQDGITHTDTITLYYFL